MLRRGSGQGRPPDSAIVEPSGAAIDLRNHQVSRAHYCVPKSVTFEQVIRVLVKWLGANPGELNEEGYLVVQKALIYGFPCKA
jgi:Rap1a immunity proteins